MGRGTTGCLTVQGPVYGPRDFVNIWGQLGGHSPGGASDICGWDQGARPEPGPEVLGGRREPTSSLRRLWAAAWGGRWWVIHTVATLFEGSPGGTAVASLQEDRIKPELQTPGCRGDAGGSRRARGVWVLREGCLQLGSFAHRLPQPPQPPWPPWAVALSPPFLQTLIVLFTLPGVSWLCSGPAAWLLRGPKPPLWPVSAARTPALQLRSPGAPVPRDTDGFPGEPVMGAPPSKVGALGFSGLEHGGARPVSLALVCQGARGRAGEESRGGCLHSRRTAVRNWFPGWTAQTKLQLRSPCWLCPEVTGPLIASAVAP